MRSPNQPDKWGREKGQGRGGQARRTETRENGDSTTIYAIADLSTGPIERGGEQEGLMKDEVDLHTRVPQSPDQVPCRSPTPCHG